MELKRETEVLVVGAGPVGMMTGACLAQRGIRTQILDQGYRPAARSYALALHSGTLAILERLGLAQTIVERGKIVDTVAFYDGEQRRLSLDLAALETRFPYAVVLPQSILEEALAQRLKALGVPVLWNHRGTDLRIGEGMAKVGVEKLIEESAGYGALRRHTGNPPVGVHSFFVVGADGYRSAVRQALKLEYEDLGSRTFGVFEFESPWNPEQEVRVVLDSRSTNVLWPLGGNRLRWSFELTQEQRSSPRLKRRLLMQMGEEAFPFLAQELLEEMIAQRAPWFTAPIHDVIWSIAVQFDRRLVPRFGSGNAWLVGDAAHLVDPAGVHSMNIGMREADDLARRFYEILREGAPHTTLEEYNEERLAEWRPLYGLNGKPRPREGTDDWVAINALRILTSLPASGEELLALVDQIGLELI